MSFDRSAVQVIRSLALLCRPAPQRGAAAGLPGGASLETLLTAAAAHGVLGLVVGALQGGAAGPLAEDVEEALAICREGLALDARRAEAQLAEVLGLFAARGLQAMPIKGPVVALAYADPALRPCRDLDVMVHAGDVPHVVACLEGAGFVHERGLDAEGLGALRRYAGECIMFRAGGLPVEPHWRPAPWTMAFDLDMGGVWRRGRPTALWGAACTLPSAEDQFLLLALHGAKERWHRLKWLADLPALLEAHPALNVDAMRGVAAANGCRRVVDLALVLSHLTFGVPGAAPAADRVTHRLAREVLERLERTALPVGGPYAVTWFHWNLHERLRDRVRYAVRTLSTPRVAHYRRLRLPAGLRWLHVPLKLPWDYLLTPLLGRWRGR